jgi:protein TonB
LHCLRKITFYHGLAISLLLHASLALPFLLPPLHAAKQSQQEKLRIELFGMISNRQVEERHEGTENPQQEKKMAQQENQAVPRPSADTYQTVAAKSPVQSAKAEDNPNQAQPVFRASLPVDSSKAGAAVEQRQQSINSKAALQEYMAKVTKRIQTNLVYPKEVRENGVEGITLIAFTITTAGDIREDSLRVQKSSGYAALDSSAVKSAQDSAPFEKPPKELDIAIAVAFDVDRL